MESAGPEVITNLKLHMLDLDRWVILYVQEVLSIIVYVVSCYVKMGKTTWIIERGENL